MKIPILLRQQKLAALVKDAGFESLHDLYEATLTDVVAPGICASPDCDYTTDTIEPDQDAGYCEACGKNSVVSALVLAGLI